MLKKSYCHACHLSSRLVQKVLGPKNFSLVTRKRGDVSIRFQCMALLLLYKIIFGKNSEFLIGQNFMVFLHQVIVKKIQAKV